MTPNSIDPARHAVEQVDDDGDADVAAVPVGIGQRQEAGRDHAPGGQVVGALHLDAQLPADHLGADEQSDGDDEQGGQDTPGEIQQNPGFFWPCRPLVVAPGRGGGSRPGRVNFSYLPSAL